MDEPTGADRVIELPCGQRGLWDGTGYRCQGCFAIWGSMACRCSREPQPGDAK